MESDFFSLYCISRHGGFPRLGMDKAGTDLRLLEHNRITVPFAALSLFLNTGEASGNLASKGVLRVDKPRSHWWDKNPGERLRA